jgi:uncharacterized protein (UPF0333 family)
MKAQISTEYLIIVGIAIAAIIPAGYLFYTYSSTSNDQAIRGQIETIGNEMVINAESVYGLADGSLVSLDVKYPETIVDVYILNGNELIIIYELSSGITESVFFSNVILSGTIVYPRGVGPVPVPPLSDSTFTANAPTQGKKSLRFESKTNYVLITQQ